MSHAARGRPQVKSCTANKLIRKWAAACSTDIREIHYLLHLFSKCMALEEQYEPSATAPSTVRLGARAHENSVITLHLTKKRFVPFV